MKHLGWLLLSVLLVINLPGCAKTTVDPVTGEPVPVRVPPPTTEEVKALAYAATRLAVNSSEIRQDQEKLQALRGHLEIARGALSAALAMEEPALTQVRVNAVKGLDQNLAVVLDLTVGIVIGRVRPLIDQTQTDEAQGYVNAAIDGALLALGIPGKPV